MVVQRVEPSGCKHSCLSHAASHDFSRPMGFRNEGLRSHEHRAHGASQSLAQAQRHAVKEATVVLQGRGIAPFAALDPRVPHAGAVQVKTEAPSAAGFRKARQLIHVPHGATPFVARVFHGDQRGARVMAVGGIDVGDHLLQVIPSAVAIHQAHGCPRIAGDATSFVVVNVGELVANDLIARAGVHLDGDLVGHGAGRAKQRRLMSRQFGAALLQGLDAFIFPKHVVSHGGVKHGLTHGGKGCVTVSLRRSTSRLDGGGWS